MEEQFQPQRSRHKVHGEDKEVYLERKVKEAEEFIRSGEVAKSLERLDEAIAVEPRNHILYGNRSKAFYLSGDFRQAWKDAKSALTIAPNWAKGHYRGAVALHGMGRYADALASFCAGLGKDPHNIQLMRGLVEAALASPLAEKFNPVYEQLRNLSLDSNAFVLAAVIGQELLSLGYHSTAVTSLEAALQIGSCSLKLRGSVLSAMSRAYWAQGKVEKAIVYMQQDLQVSKELGDEMGECRAAGNLGTAYYCRRHLDEALSNQRIQLELSTRLQDRMSAIMALSNMGHTYSALGDFPNALSSHKQAALLCRQCSDPLGEAREIASLGGVYLSMGEPDHSLDCYREYLRLATGERDHCERGHALCCLGNAHLWKREYEMARSCFREALQLASRLGETGRLPVEGKACAGLGHCARSAGDFKLARQYHQRQLDCALSTKDRVMEARACSSLGIIFHQFGKYEDAIKLHKAHLKLALDLEDRGAEGRAYGNIGNGYSALEQHHLAISYHQKELAISQAVDDRRSQCVTHGNLAVAYQSINDFTTAEYHHEQHLRMARHLPDRFGEMRALNNLGNFRCSRGQYEEALRMYEDYRRLSQQLGDLQSEGSACHKIGYVCYALGRYDDAVRYYEQDVFSAEQMNNNLNLMRAHCNLGLAFKQLGNFPSAVQHQQTFLRLSGSNTEGQFKALGNIGDLYMCQNQYEDAVSLFSRQLDLAEKANNSALLVLAHSNLGSAYEMLGDLGHAGKHYQRELELCRSLEDTQSECRALGHVGSVQLRLGHHEAAYRLFDGELACAHKLEGSASWRLKAAACGHLGACKVAQGEMEAAVGYLQQQLALLEGCGSMAAATWFLKERSDCYIQLGDCYSSLGDHEEAVRCYDRLLPICQKTGDVSAQMQAYCGLSRNHKSLGHLSQALVCLEKRLMLAHESKRLESLAGAYGDLGTVHIQMSNYEQALSCLQHQLKIAKQSSDRRMEADAAAGLGKVYQLMSEYSKALDYHGVDLRLAESFRDPLSRCRALGNLATTYEAMGDEEQALRNRQLHLTSALEASDARAQLEACGGLGRVHHGLGNYQSAIHYLYQGLKVCENTGDCREEEAKIRHRLGLSLWASESLEDAQNHMLIALDLFDAVRRDLQHTMDYKVDLFDQQTACYQSLQRIMVSLESAEDALAIAERGRTRALVDLLLERQDQSPQTDGLSEPLSFEKMKDLILREKCHCLYMSLAAGYLYIWLLSPYEGLVKFHAVDLNDLLQGYGDDLSICGGDVHSITSVTSGILDSLVFKLRESLGVDSGTGSIHSSSSIMSLSSSMCSPVDDDEDACSLVDGRPAFLRLINRDDVCNRSSRSLVSTSSTRSAAGRGMPVAHLHQFLIAPFEAHLPSGPAPDGAVPRLVLVLQGDLHLIPFPALRPPTSGAQFLGERFALSCVPSLSALAHAHCSADEELKLSSLQQTEVTSTNSTLVIGNPFLPHAVTERWHWTNIPHAEHECRSISELLGCKPVLGAEATKKAVIDLLCGREILHFAVHVVWKLAALVLSPPNCSPGDKKSSAFESPSRAHALMDSAPALHDFLLTAAEIMNLQLRTCRLVFLSTPYSNDRAGRSNADGVLGLARSFLVAGAQCVVLSLWPLPEASCRQFVKNFYIGLLREMCISEAMHFAIKAMRESPQFSKPMHWSGWLALGRDTCLSSRAVVMGKALASLLMNPLRSRHDNRLRVLLHLTEKALQRVRLRGNQRAPPLYTPVLSIIHRMGVRDEELCEETSSPWRDLLQSVGFRFDRQEGEEVVFFPSSDPANRLAQCSACLQAQLSLPGDVLDAMAQVLCHSKAFGSRLLAIIREALASYGRSGASHICSVSSQLWRAKGCHEFFAAMGFDLVEVGSDQVRLQCGKGANRRQLQMALTVFLAVFETQAAPRSCPSLESSSSQESLTNSSEAGASPSDSGEHGQICLPLHTSLTARVLSVDEPDEVNSVKNGSTTASVKSGRDYFPPSQPSIRPTSASSSSENEEGAANVDAESYSVASLPNFNRSSQSRSSTMSGSSTLTGGSGCTLTSSSLPRHRARNKDRSSNAVKAERYSLSPGPQTRHPAPASVQPSPSTLPATDPSQLALQVLADTHQQMAAVDSMQRLSAPTMPDPNTLLIFSASALCDEGLYEHQLSTISEVSDSDISAMSLPTREHSIQPIRDISISTDNQHMKAVGFASRPPVRVNVDAGLLSPSKDQAPSVTSNSSGYSSNRDFLGNASASSGSEHDSETSGKPTPRKSPPKPSKPQTGRPDLARSSELNQGVEIRASPMLKDFITSGADRSSFLENAKVTKEGNRKWPSPAPPSRQSRLIKDCVLKASDC